MRSSTNLTSSSRWACYHLEIVYVSLEGFPVADCVSYGLTTLFRWRSMQSSYGSKLGKTPVRTQRRPNAFSSRYIIVRHPLPLWVFQQIPANQGQICQWSFGELSFTWSELTGRILSFRNPNSRPLIHPFYHQFLANSSDLCDQRSSAACRHDNAPSPGSRTIPKPPVCSLLTRLHFCEPIPS